MSDPTLRVVGDESDPTAALTTSDDGRDRPSLKLKEALPTAKLQTETQLGLVRAWVIATDNGQTPATNGDVANISHRASVNIAAANAFFEAAGLLSGGSRSRLATAESVDYLRAHEFGAPDAAHRLAPALQKAWFWKELGPALQMQPIPKQEAVLRLAQRASARTEHVGQLNMILEWMETVGLVRFDGQMIHRCLTPPPLTLDDAVAAPVAAPPMPDQPGRTSGGPVQESTTKPNGINFSVDISVDMTEMAAWEADRIQAFFLGLSAVISAKRG
jgi:hypothetical protein